MRWVLGSVMALTAAIVSAVMYIAVGREMDRDTRSERWGEDDRQSPRSKPDSRKSAVGRKKHILFGIMIFLALGTWVCRTQQMMDSYDKLNDSLIEFNAFMDEYNMLLAQNTDADIECNDTLRDSLNHLDEVILPSVQMLIEELQESRQFCEKWKEDTNGSNKNLGEKI